jgi:hypothetical protein
MYKIAMMTPLQVMKDCPDCSPRHQMTWEAKFVLDCWPCLILWSSYGSSPKEHILKQNTDNKQRTNAE